MFNLIYLLFNVFCFVLEIFKTLFKCWFQYGKKNFRLWVGLRPVVYIVNSADMEVSAIDFCIIISKSKYIYIIFLSIYLQAQRYYENHQFTTYYILGWDKDF